MPTYTVTCSNPFHRHATVTVSGTTHELAFSPDAERGVAVATDVPGEVADELADDPAYTLHPDVDDTPEADASDTDTSDADAPDEDEGDDDLTTLTGVGPATAATLKEAGITTFDALAEATAIEGVSDEQLDDLRGRAKAHL